MTRIAEEGAYKSITYVTDEELPIRRPMCHSSFSE